MKTKLLILLGVFFAGVTFAQKPEIKQGPLAKGVKVTNLAMYIGEDENYYYFFDCSIKTTVLGFDKTDLSLKVEKEFKSKLTVRFPVYGGVYGETIELVSHEVCLKDKKKYASNFKHIEEESQKN